MSLISIVPAQVDVRCGAGGRPAEIRVGRERMRVSAVEAVRAETSAYPAAQGPRTIYILRMDAWRVRLAFHHRDGRWLVEALDPRPHGLALAA